MWLISGPSPEPVIIPQVPPGVMCEHCWCGCKAPRNNKIALNKDLGGFSLLIFLHYISEHTECPFNWKVWLLHTCASHLDSLVA